MVFQACNHPFVLQMDYAFQTELHAIIVLNLVTTGNLQVRVRVRQAGKQARRHGPRQARFVVVEIGFASAVTVQDRVFSLEE